MTRTDFSRARSRYLVFAAMLCALAAPGCGPAADDMALRPNFVLFFADDAGYADFGFQGNPRFETPNIDALAKEGIRFTQAYVTASVCSPSRAGLLTGRYQQRFGHEYNLPGMDDLEVPAQLRGLPLSELTLADLLKQEGYATGLVGKWHLGLHPRFHPEERGFDEFFGMVGGGSPYAAGTANRITSNYRDVDPTSLPYLTDAFGDEAAEFVARHRDVPFFLFVSFNAPHTPMQARPDYLDAARADFETDVRATNAAMTRSLDENVGKVLRALSDHGLAENTLVIFTNDNGGAMPYNGSLNEPLRGTKGTVLEGGIRVPFVLKWPAALAGNRTFTSPVSTLDILPTIVQAAGAALPEDRQYDGVDLTPHLSRASGEPPHDVLFWKLNWGAAVRRGNWKLVRNPAGERWLFDLDADVGETTDLLRENRSLAAELGEELDRWESTLPDPVWVSAPMWRAHSLLRYNQDTVRAYLRR